MGGQVGPREAAWTRQALARAELAFCLRSPFSGFFVTGDYGAGYEVDPFKMKSRMLIVLEVLERLIKESRLKAYGLWEGHGTWGAAAGEDPTGSRHCPEGAQGPRLAPEAPEGPATCSVWLHWVSI